MNGSYARSLYAIRADGTQKWSFAGPGYTSPVIGDDGAIYVSTGIALCSLAADGSLNWTCPFKAGTSGYSYPLSSPVIGSNGTIYVGSSCTGDGQLYAFTSSSHGPANSPWPMYRHDAQRTGRFGATNPDTNGDAIPDAWELQYFGSLAATNGGATNDWDHDGMSNLAEYLAGTDLTNEQSVLKMTSASTNTGTNFVLRWASVAGKTYTIQNTTNLLAGFSTAVATNVPGVGGENVATVHVSHAAEFFRVKLE